MKSSILSISSVLLIFAYSLRAEPQALKTHYQIASIEGFHSAKLAQVVVKEAYKEIGFTVDFVENNAEQSINFANQGKFDAELVRIKNIHQSYPNLLMLPIPILELELKIFTHNRRINVYQQADLMPYKIGIVKGHKIAEQLTENYRVEAKPTLEELWQMLEKDQLDLLLLDRNSALISLTENKISNIKMSDTPFEKMSLYHYIHKKNRAIFDALNNVLQSMQDSGRISLPNEKFVYGRL